MAYVKKNKPRQSERVVARLTEKEKAEFDEALLKKGEPMSVMLRRCIKNYIKNNKEA